MSYGKILTALTVMLGLAGCATDRPSDAQTGNATASVATADQGRDAGKDAAPSVASAAAIDMSAYMDKQEHDFDQALASELQQKQVEINRVKDDTLKLSLSNEGSFAINKAVVRPALKPVLDKLAEVLAQYNLTAVDVVGFTDTSGSPEHNLDLSQQRAQAVMEYLGKHGVPEERLHAEGRGENEPRASNDTEAGRRLNRRVEIYVEPLAAAQH